MKFEYRKDTSELLIYNKREINNKTYYEFIGQCFVSDLDDNLMELDRPLARPKYGQLLYQAAMMYATMQNKSLCMTRSGDIREAALNPFEFIKKEYENGNNKIQKEIVPEKYNDELYEWTNEDDTPVLFEAFKLEVNDKFKDSLQVLSKREYSFLPKNVYDEWNEYFTIAYENDTNKFIEENEPLSKPIDFNPYMSIEKNINKRKHRLKLK